MSIIFIRISILKLIFFLPEYVVMYLWYKLNWIESSVAPLKQLSNLKMKFVLVEDELGKRRK